MKQAQYETRLLQFDHHRADQKTMTCPCSISSEEPVSRFWGVEILEHTESAVDLSRAMDGTLPLLLSHDPDPVPRPGNLERIRLQGRKLRGLLRLADTDKGRELWDAIRDGLLSGVSIGYRIEEAKQDGADERTGQPIFRITRWQPVEVSLVNLPADVTVGIGRSLPAAGKEGPTMPPEIEVLGEERGAKHERERSRFIRQAAEKFPQIQEFCDRAVENGMSIEQFRKGFITEMERTSTKWDPDRPKYDMSGGGFRASELDRFSLSRAILALCTRDWSEAGFEREVSRQMVRQRGRDTEGIVIPLEVFQQRDILKSGAGVNLIGTDHLAGEFVDMLRPFSVVVAAGARMLPGLVGDVSIPRLATGATAYWVAEGNAVTESTPVPDALTLAPKSCGGLVEVSRKMLLQSSPAVEQMIQDDLIGMLGTAVDKVAIKGGGSGEPTGVLGTAGIGSVLAGNSDCDWTVVTKLIGEVAADNALGGRLAYVTNPLVQGQALRSLKDAGSGQFVWEPAIGGTGAHGTIAGYPAYATANVPSNLGAGTNRSACIFGNWNDLLIGQWGGLEILVNPFDTVGFPKGNVFIRALIDVDVKLRHPESFAAAQDIDPTV